MDPIYQIILITFVGFAAGIINTLAGGGSLITLSTMIFLGMPPNIANATNRLGILSQTFSGVLGFRSKGVINFPFSIYVGISALAGALIGAKLALDINMALFNKILAIIMIVVAIIIILKERIKLNKGIELKERLKGKHLVISIIAFFGIGVYGGFINAGIGIIVMLFLNNVNRLSLVKTNATKVAIAFTYTMGAFIFFAINNQVDWKMGLFLALGNGLGAWFTSRWSVKKGDKVIKIVMLVVIVGMAIKLWFF